GKKVANAAGALRVGNVVNLKVHKKPRALSESILEVRVVKEAAAEPSTPEPPKDGVSYKNAIYMGQVPDKDGNRKHTWRPRDGSLVYAEPGNRAKGYDTDGKDVGVLAVLRVGNVFDLVVQPGAAMGSVVEMRLVKRAELTSGQMKEMSHEGAVL